MLHVPLLRVETLQADLQFGLMIQPTHAFSEDCFNLVGQNTARTGILLEVNAGSEILQPVPRWQDFGAGVTHSGADTGTWRVSQKRATGKNCLLQYSSVAGGLWDVTSPADTIPAVNQSFTLDLYLGAAPKGATYDNSDIYRKIVWPADAVTGQNMYRVTISFQETPYLELSVDAGSTWMRLGEIDNPTDLTTLQSAENVHVTLSVMVINGTMLLWLGEGFNRFAKQVSGNTIAGTNYPAGYGAGKISINGKNGYTVIGFGIIRYKLTGTLTTPTHYGPNDMHTHSPVFQLIGQVDSAGGQTATASLNAPSVDETNHTFDFDISLGATADGTDTNYANNTPAIQYINGQWPPVYTSPTPGTWTPMTGIYRFEERLSWDPDTRLMIRSFRIRVKNFEGENAAVPGLQAIRIFTGWAHMAGQPGFDSEGFCLTPRGYAIANNTSLLNSNGPSAFFEFTATDLLYIMQSNVLMEQVFPAQSCVYALAHLLMECGGIVPDLAVNIDNCTLGLDPTVITSPQLGQHPGDACLHTKFGAAPKWDQLLAVMGCMADLMKAEFATFGMDSFGQMVFQNFDPTTSYTVKKVFMESPDDGGVAYNALLSRGYSPYVIDGLIRTRSLDSVINQIILGGLDKDTGSPFTSVYNDADSVSGSRTGANYLGFVRRFVDMWTGYDSQTFADAVRSRMAQWMRLPDERILLVVMGQPELFPLDVILVQERRTVGFNTGIYYITDIVSVMEPPGIGDVMQYTSTIWGRWTGAFEGDTVGQPPGTS